MDDRADEVDIEDRVNVYQVKCYRQQEEASSTQPRHIDTILEGATRVRAVYMLCAT